MDVLRTRPQLVGDAAAPRGGRRLGRRDLGARGDSRAGCRHRAASGRARRSSTRGPTLSLVENFMFKMSGRVPDPPKARALDAYFTLAAEHGMNASTFTGTRDRLDAVRHRIGSRRRRRCAQGQAPRRRAEPRVAHDRRDRHGRERGAVATREARRGRAADGVRPPRLPDVRPARPRARQGRRDALAGRTSGWRSRARSRRRRCACCTSTSRTARCTRTSSTTRPRCSATSTCPPTCTPRRSPLRAPRAGRRTCSSSLRTTG